MILEIDLGAIAANYRACAALSGGARIGAVVKADAYGLGMDKVAPILWRAGCRVFFVALLQEGVSLRGLLPDADIYILNGLAAGEAETMAEQGLRPCLASVEEIEAWAGWCDTAGRDVPAAVHVESGMNRLGLPAKALAGLLASGGALTRFRPALVMSHLACASEPDNPLNRHQLEAFRALCQTITAQTGTIEASLVNSAGMMLGADWHFDLIRAGIALYGGVAHPQLRGAVRAWSKVMAIKQIAKGQTAGYGGEWRASAPSRLAVIPSGYADGLPYHLWQPDAGRAAHFVIEGRRVPLAGRVSMDMVSLDISALPKDSIQIGSKVEIVGDAITLTELALAARSIPHAILTGLGKRAEKRYIAP